MCCKNQELRKVGVLLNYLKRTLSSSNADICAIMALNTLFFEQQNG